MPTNPYTAQPVRLVRMGERKCEGELTFMKGSSYIGNVSTSELNRNDDLLIIAYGNREEGFIKYADWRFFPEGNELWSDELASKLVWITGGLAVGGKTMGGGAYWYRDSDEEIYTANGYTLPIQMEKEAFPGDDQ